MCEGVWGVSLESGHAAEAFCALCEQMPEAVNMDEMVMRVCDLESRAMVSEATTRMGSCGLGI